MKVERKPPVCAGTVDPDAVEHMRGKQKQAVGGGGVFMAFHQIIRVALQKEKDFIEIVAMKGKILCGVLGNIISEVDFIPGDVDALVHGNAPLA